MEDNFNSMPIRVILHGYIGIYRKLYLKSIAVTETNLPIFIGRQLFSENRGWGIPIIHEDNEIKIAMGNEIINFDKYDQWLYKIDGDHDVISEKFKVPDISDMSVLNDRYTRMLETTTKLSNELMEKLKHNDGLYKVYTRMHNNSNYSIERMAGYAFARFMYSLDHNPDLDFNSYTLFAMNEIYNTISILMYKLGYDCVAFANTCSEMILSSWVPEHFKCEAKYPNASKQFIITLFEENMYIGASDLHYNSRLSFIDIDFDFEVPPYFSAERNEMIKLLRRLIATEEYNNLLNSVGKFNYFLSKSLIPGGLLHSYQYDLYHDDPLCVFRPSPSKFDNSDIENISRIEANMSVYNNLQYLRIMVYWNDHTVTSYVASPYILFNGDIDPSINVLTQLVTASLIEYKKDNTHGIDDEKQTYLYKQVDDYISTIVPILYRLNASRTSFSNRDAFAQYLSGIVSDNEASNRTAFHEINSRLLIMEMDGQ